MTCIKTALIIVATMIFSVEVFAQAAPKKTRLYVAPLQHGADPIRPELKEALRARIEEGLAATKVFEIETRLEEEALAILDERKYVVRAKSKSIDLIIFPVVDSLTCYREARPITAMPGKYNHKAKCDSIVRVRVISPKTDTLRTSFELDEALEKRLGVVDQLEIDQLYRQVGDTEGQFAHMYRFPVKMDTNSREFVELARKLSAALANRIYEDAYPPEVIEVIGGQLYVSRGTRGGFNVNDILSVHSKTGRVLYHPVTREKIGEATINLGTIRITEAYDDYSVGVVETTTGPIIKGAVVRRSSE